uniref:WIF domain-containing protein n=1 Tax=Trichogramma kaykai TaxID=54128 RepID=A0ABD2VSN9_9HYME
MFNIERQERSCVYAVNLIFSASIPMPVPYSILRLAYSMKLDYDSRGGGYRGSGIMALLPPKVNVSSHGYVPTSPQVFAIRLPCSGIASAEIKLALKINVSAPAESRYDDTRLVFKRNKICMQGIRTQSKNDSVTLQAGPLANNNGAFYIAASCACALILVVVGVASVIYIRNSKARSQLPRKNLNYCSYSATGTGALTGSSILVKVDNRPGSANSGSYATIADLEPLYARPCGSRASYYAASHVTHLSQSTDPCEKARAVAVARKRPGGHHQDGHRRSLGLSGLSARLGGLAAGRPDTRQHHDPGGGLPRRRRQSAAGLLLHAQRSQSQVLPYRRRASSGHEGSRQRRRADSASWRFPPRPRYTPQRHSGEKLPIGWMALETLQHGQYSTASDSWSFGVFLWELATMGQQPYAEVDPFELTAFLRDGYRLSQPRPCPDELFALMAVCWLGPSRDRPTMPQLLAYLQEFYDALGGFI